MPLEIRDDAESTDSLAVSFSRSKRAAPFRSTGRTVLTALRAALFPSRAAEQAAVESDLPAVDRRAARDRRGQPRAARDRRRGA